MKIPFLNRGSNNNSDLPAEVQEYYQSERRERVGIAWLLAGGTLILTLLLAFGLFFGGRWAYNKIAGNDSGSETTAQQEDTDDKDEKNDDSATNGDTNTNDTTGTSSATTTTPSAPAPQPSVAPATTTGPNNLPNTGPTGDDL